jgi:SAM-dependent methyltransferase
VRRRLELDDSDAVGSRRIELGPGSRPSAGYIHVDNDPWAAHVDVLLKGAALPFETGWADEILAIHVLEHVPPAQMIPTLQEWRRCLRTGGFLQVHVPDSRALAGRFAAEEDPARKWALMGALLGMYANPTVDHPAKLSQPADHQVLFDTSLLDWALREAGFTVIENLTGSTTDIHTEGWRDLVPNLSLIFRAYK